MAANPHAGASSTSFYGGFSTSTWRSKLFVGQVVVGQATLVVMKTMDSIAFMQIFVGFVPQEFKASI
jgi:glucose/arabinose dehydrogenase